MRKYNFVIFTLILTLLGTPLIAQKATKDMVPFKYLRNPLQKFDASIRSYNVEAIIPWKEAEKQKEIEYNKELDKAEKEYEEALYKFENRSAGTVIAEALTDNKATAPTKRSVAKPIYRFVPENSSITSSVSLDGFKKATSNNITIIVTLEDNGVVTPKKNVKDKEGVNYYSYQASIKQVLSYEVKDESGSVVYSSTVEASNKAKALKSKEYKGVAWHVYKNEQWPAYLKAQKKALIEKNVGELVKELNFRFGYSNVKTYAKVFSGKGKKFNYDKHVLAATKAKRAYENILLNKEEAVSKFNDAITIWKAEITELDASDKKARINNEIAQALYCNIIEAYITMGEYKIAEETIDTLAVMSDLKKRFKNYSQTLNKFLLDEKKRNL